jgi:uncharacterized membrane protein
MAMALCNALYQILTRKIAGVEHPLTSLIWGAIVGAALLSAVLPFAWKTPDQVAHWALLAVIGMLASVGHYLLIRAYDYASATLLAPYSYSGLIWAMALGFVVFGNFPDGWALTGMGIIVASGTVPRQPPAADRATAADLESVHAESAVEWSSDRTGRSRRCTHRRGQRLLRARERRPYLPARIEDEHRVRVERHCELLRRRRRR